MFDIFEIKNICLEGFLQQIKTLKVVFNIKTSITCHFEALEASKLLRLFWGKAKENEGQRGHKKAAAHGTKGQGFLSQCFKKGFSS